MRNYSQFERKVVLGAQALERNKRITPKTGSNWRNLYHEHYLQGTLKKYFQHQCRNTTAIAAGLKSGELVRDERLGSLLPLLLDTELGQLLSSNNSSKY